MARVLLLQAATHKWRIERTQPLGLLYLAAALRRAGHAVRIFDLRAFPECEPERALPVLREFKPDLAGISSHSPESPVLYRLAQSIKSERPDLPVIAGGSHVTNYAEEALQDCPALDAAVIGEGERTLIELVEALAAGRPLTSVAGCLVRGGDGLVRTPRREPILELDSLPFPAWDLIDMPAYWNYPRLGVIAAQREYMLMLTSRGCPFDCAYCHHNMGRLYRPRGAENVVEEIELLRRDHGVGEIVIADDSFNLIRERVHRICELILQRGLKVALTFPTGIRGDLLDDETLQLLRRAGTYRIMFAVETATPRLQKLINKNVDFPKLERAMHTARRLGMLLHGAAMLGLPTETEQEMRATIRYIRRSPLHTIGLYRATPYKGCELYEAALRMGLVLPEKQHTMSLWESGVNLSAAPLQTVNRLSRRAYFQFYGNPARMLGLLWRLPNKRSMLPLLARLFIKNIRGYRSRSAA